jgi:hypothetical protein
MFEEKIKTQRLFYGFSNYRRILNKLLNQGKKYYKFLTNIMGYQKLFSEDEIVRVKDVSQRLKVNPDKIRKYLELIYDDIAAFLCSEEKRPIKPGTPVCSITI